MKTRSTSASHSLEGQHTKSTTVKWSINNCVTEPVDRQPLTWTQDVYQSPVLGNKNVVLNYW